MLTSRTSNGPGRSKLPGTVLKNSNEKVEAKLAGAALIKFAGRKYLHLLKKSTRAVNFEERMLNARLFMNMCITTIILERESKHLNTLMLLSAAGRPEGPAGTRGWGLTYSRGLYPTVRN